MADGHARTTGASYSIATLGGKSYKLRPLTVGNLAEQEAFIISKREDPTVWASRACMVAPDEQHRTIWEVAMEKSIRARTVTGQEAEEFRRSSLGIAWMFWVCARKDHPEVDSPEAAMKILDSANEEEFATFNATVTVASGESDLGNSTGHPENPESPAPKDGP